MDRHDCIQDTKVRENCLAIGRLEEKSKQYDKNFDEIFVGKDSLKTQITQTSDCVESIDGNVKGYISSLKWFIGIIVGLQLLIMTGGLGYVANRLDDHIKSTTMHKEQATRRSAYQQTINQSNFGG